MAPAPAGHSISEGLIALLRRPVDATSRDRAALHLLDWLGCALIGRAEPVGRAAATLAGKDPLAIVGAGTAQAAGTLGALGSLLEMDDVHKAALLHPGPVVAATVMALPGTDPLAALVRGYEAMIRLGRSVGPAHYASFHNTGTCGGIGSAVAAAGLLGLDDRQAADAMAHALSLAGGLWQCRNEPVETKHLHVAEATRRGVQAALWAQAGLKGPRFILEGPQGFFAGLAPDGDPSRILARENDWLIHEVSFKPWPACRHTHPAIDAALALRKRLSRTPVAVHVATYRDALLFCDRPNPATAPEARFSLQHAVAVALGDGPPAPSAFAAAALPARAKLRARVTVAEDADMTAAYPARFGAKIIVTDDSDQVLTESAADAWGDPENPMDATAVRDKFRRLAAAAGIAPDMAAGIEADVLRLPSDPDMVPLRASLHHIAKQLAS